MHKRLAAFALIFLVAHLPLLPPTLEDLDSINFALGVRDFNVARHQPHPPGYPIFIALAKSSTAALRASGVTAPDVRGLAVWSVLGGAAAIPLLFLLFRAFGDERRAWWATVVTACSPLYWFTALRPLSDMTGLALAVAAQGLLGAVVLGRAPAGALLGGAFLSTLAIGIRSQTFVLTLPLLLWAFLIPGAVIGIRERLSAAAAAVAGGLVWGVPLLLASGGLASYLTALGSQAGEDFSGVVILWTVRQARIAAQALAYTFLWPWGTPWIGAVVVVVAGAGAVRLLWRAPRVAVVLAVAFVPYAVFHLLFHEIVTVRYALPLVIPIAYLFVVAVDWQPSKGRPASSAILPVAASALAAAGLVQVAAPSWRYSRMGSPAFRAFEEARRSAAADGAIAMHAFARRIADWEADKLRGHVLEAPHGREWLAAAEELRRGRQLMFVASPRRTDLALFDPRSLVRAGSYTWGFIEPPFVGGARPGNTDLYRIVSPGWILDRGWALTAEVGGVTERDGGGPHKRPSVGWIRSRQDSAVLSIGGRHLGAAGAPRAEITVTVANQTLAQWTVSPGFFVKRFELPPGTLGAPDAGLPAFIPLAVTSRTADISGGEVRVSLEQFDVQSGSTPMLAFEDGWLEPEYNPLTAAAWRWMSDHAQLWVRPIGRDVTLQLTGESPLRYYDDAPVLRVSAGEMVIAEFRPSADFTYEVTLPHAALAGAEGRVVITSDKHFIPAGQGGSPDQRRLAVRMYGVHVR